MLEEEEFEVPVSASKESRKEDTEMDADESSTGETDVNMQDSKPPADGSGAGSEHGAGDSADKPVQMETDAKVC